jgi:hypothetical protein
MIINIQEKAKPELSQFQGKTIRIYSSGAG